MAAAPPRIRDPPAARWSLSIYTEKTPAKLPLLDSDPSAPHSIIFVPGLTDTFGTCPYLDRLVAGVAPYGFSVVQLQLSSSLGGFGVCSLEGDAQEMARAVSWLREKRGKDKVVLMGHSTGCQDAMAYLSHPRGCEGRGKEAVVDAVVLQAPVSDRESWESEYAWEKEGGEKKEGSESSDESSSSATSSTSSSSSSSESESSKEKARQTLAEATRLVQEGKGSQLLPRDVEPVRRPTLDDEDTKQRGNVDAVNDSPMTAYRYWSLFAKGGDDDFFSTDLGDEATRDIWKAAARGLREGGPGHVLALVGAEDEFIPRPHITPEKIVDTWKQAASLPGDEASRALLSRCRFEILAGANHKVEAAEAQLLLVARVRELIKAMGVPLLKTPATTTGAAAGGSAAAPPAARRLPPSLSKGIPAWQLAEEPATAPAAAATTTPATTTAASTTAPTAVPARSDASVGSSANTTAAAAAAAAAPASSSIPPHPPSFDALVELIATGRTDEIQGIRDIPLKINEEAPSESKLDAPRKPWEQQQEGQQQQ